MSKLLISLKDFAQTGKFGPVGLGTKKEEALKLLGEPDADSYLNTDCCIFHFNWTEFFYHPKTREVFAIQNDHLHQVAYENAHFRLDPWVVGKDRPPRLGEVQQELGKLGWAYEQFNSYGSLIIQLQSGVTMDFSAPEEDGEELVKANLEEYEMHGIRLFRDSFYRRTE